MKYELYNDLVDFFEYHRFKYGMDFEEKMTRFMETAEKYEVQYYKSKEAMPVNVRVECEIYEDHPGYETYHRDFKSELEKGRVFMYSDVTKQHLDLDYEKPSIDMTGTIVDIESSLPAGWENKVTPISIEEYFQKKIDYKINVCKESIVSPTEINAIEAKAKIDAMFEDDMHELLQFTDKYDIRQLQSVLAAPESASTLAKYEVLLNIQDKFPDCPDTLKNAAEIYSRSQLMDTNIKHVLNAAGNIASVYVIEDTNDELGLKINHLTDLKSKTESYLHENKITIDE